MLQMSVLLCVQLFPLLVNGQVSVLFSGVCWGCVSHSRGSNGPQPQKGRGELVAYESPRAGIRLCVVLVVL